MAYYGITCFTPQILDKICLSGTKEVDIHGNMTCTQTLFQVAWQSVLTTSFGIPGCLVAILLLERIGSKRLNVYGFLLIALNCVAFAAVYQWAPDNNTLLFALYCVLQFVLNFGPNLGTYVVPAICFPAKVRSTCHGLSAMGGKIGACVGTLSFNALPLPLVFMANAGVCLIGLMVSSIFLRHDWEYLEEDDRVATSSFIKGQGRVTSG